MESSIIKRERVLVAPAGASPARPAKTACAPVRKAEPVVVGGHVRAIEVTCGCGDVLLVELEYADDAQGGSR